MVIDEKAVFVAALALPDTEEREAYLQEACAGHPELLGRLRELLSAHDESQGPLDRRPEALGVTVDAAHPECPGTVIGPYKLLEQIGEGGMGTVWMAQQTEPVKRLVAVKLIKAGTDSKQVIARFEAERQALALMDHPNIARVLDAGTTSARRPYFVMDLVKGVPITRYCDEHHLTPRQRLELFLPVCQAVQHAHQKGIIHRDLKPSNVLVALYDGKPVPKVIDFGVAKAAGQQLTDKTLVTGFGNIVGTLEYMSPEQAEVNQLDIDTRSDIYSLGVLLYELLAGSPPFSRKDLEQAGMLEMLRVIREQEPAKPSTKLSSSDALPTLSANRGTEPAKLTRLVRGELDWIVMKALEKDRNRRYETANGFAMDVQRYLADEAVQACPPSAGYRLRKFVRRNKVGLAFTGLILVILLTLTGAIGWNTRDRAARRAILEAEVTAALDEAEKVSKRERFPEALSAVKRAEGLLASGGGSTELQERVSQWREDLDLVIALEDATIEGIEVDIATNTYSYAPAKVMYEAAFRKYGIDLGSTTTEQAVRGIRSRPPQIQLVMLEALYRWWALEWSANRASEEQRKQAWLVEIIKESDSDSWRTHMRQAAYARDYKKLEDLGRAEAVAKQGPLTLRTLADFLDEGGRRDLGIALLRRAQHAYPGHFLINADLGRLLLKEPASPEVVRYWAVAVAIRPDDAGAHLNLGSALHYLDKLDEAIVEFRKAIELKPGYAMAHYNLGNAFRERCQFDDAIAAYREAIKRQPNFASAHNNLGATLSTRGFLDEAIAAYREAIRLEPDSRNAHLGLSSALHRGSKPDEAIAEYKEVTRLDPGNWGVHNNLGALLCDHTRDYDGAIAAFREALRLRPEYPEAQAGLGTALRRKGRSDEAITAYRTAIRLKPDLQNAHLGLGISLSDKGKSEEAVAAIKEAIRLRPDHAEAYATLGMALDRQGKMDEAIAAYKEAIRLKPDLPEAYTNLGAILCDEKKDYGGAIRAIRKSILLQPTNSRAHWNLGRALSRNGELDEAIAEYTEATRLQPHFPEAHHNLGIALRLKGRPGEAIANYREAVRQGIKNPRAYTDLADLLATCPDIKLRSPAEAVATARKAVELWPNNDLPWQTLGLALYRAGEWQASIDALQKSADLEKGGDSAQWFFLAMAYWKLNRKEEGRQWFDRAVKWMEKHQPKNELLLRFRAEAEELLGVRTKTD